MKIYQILVKGYYDCADGDFKCSSKNVYKNYPTQEQIDEFVEKCTHGGFFNLNKSKPYETRIVELNLI